MPGIDGDDRLRRLWTETEQRLPAGWSLEGLRCASTGLAEADRSEAWIAVAAGPGGVERQRQAMDPVDALNALAASFAEEIEATASSASPRRS